MLKLLIPKTLFLVIVTLTFTGCIIEDDDPSISLPALNSYRIQYMDYPGPVMPNTTEPKNIVNLEYDAFGNVIKRWGDLMPVNPGTGYNYYFSEGLFDEITYQGDQVIITK